MNWENFFAAFTLFGGCYYVILGLLAANHYDSQSDTTWVASPVWAFFSNAYTEKGKNYVL